MLVHFMDLPTWPIAFIWHEHTQVIIQFLIKLFCIKTFWLYILLRKKSTVVWRVISSCMCFTVYCMYYRRTGYTVKATSMEEKTDFQKQVCSYTDRILKHRLLGSLVVECWHRVREVLGSIPSQGPRHTKDVIKMVPGSSLVWHSTLKREVLALSQELR